MARYVVVVCPKCNEVQTFYANYKTRRCPKCGIKFKVSSAKKLGEFDKAKDATFFTIKIKEMIANERKTKTRRFNSLNT